MTLFLTPDGKHVVSGYLYDEKGTNLSEAFFQKEIYAPMGREMWKSSMRRIPEGGRGECPAQSLRLCRPVLPVLQAVLG